MKYLGEIKIEKKLGAKIMDNFTNFNNTELLEIIESSSIKYINTIKEFIIRLRDKKVTEEEYEKFVEIGEKMGIELIDFSDSNKYKAKETITNAISHIVDKAYDDNR